jgi:hypothetical protein
MRIKKELNVVRWLPECNSKNTTVFAFQFRLMVHWCRWRSKTQSWGCYFVDGLGRRILGHDRGFCALFKGKRVCSIDSPVIFCAAWSKWSARELDPAGVPWESPYEKIIIEIQFLWLNCVSFIPRKEREVVKC